MLRLRQGAAMKKRQRRVGIHPFIKQAIRAKWRSETVKAEIHSFMGEDKQKLMDYASVLFFVAGGCALWLEWTGDEPDFRILRGSVNALDDMNEREGITHEDRGAIHSGMLAAQRILEITPEEVVNDAALLYAERSRGYKAATKRL